MEEKDILQEEQAQAEPVAEAAAEPPKKKKKKFNTPDAYLVLFTLVVAAWLLTFFVPVGFFDVQEETYMASGVEKTRQIIDPESFQYVLDENGKPDCVRGSIFTDYYNTDATGVLNAMADGFVDGGKGGTAGMIAFILMIGGIFAIVIRTGAVDAGIWAALRKMNGKDILIIPGVMLIFALGGSIMGLAEELIPFAMILIPLLIRLGYDGITALLTCYCSMMVGFSATWMNPYTLLIAQGIADVPLMSGAGFRIVLFVIFEAALMFYTVKRGLKMKKNPQLSVTYETDELYFRQADDVNTTMSDKKLGVGEILVLLALLATFVVMFWGVLSKGWYIPQMCGVFMGGGVVMGALGAIFRMNGMRINDIALSFKQGLSDMVPVVMILALGKGITLVLGGTSNADPSVLNTILHASGNALDGLPVILSAWGMYLFQSCFNFLVCSGPAQAAISMPIMAPLADLLGVTRQQACLAFQMGDGFTNMINPTSAVLMANIGIAKIDFGVWVKFQWKMQVVLFAAGTIAMIVAVAIGFS